MINLKSNMDRFIECKLFFLHSAHFYLKSNMDRFIGKRKRNKNAEFDNLKSNMDRFIGQTFALNVWESAKFKIQYG